MAILSPSFVFGLIVLFYLLSFVLFAVVRIATGISIQRIGYFSLRHIAYTPRDGIRIDLRSLGLHLHRPTFARPTWLSLRLTDLKVTVDLKILSGNVRVNEQIGDHAVESDKQDFSTHDSPTKPLLSRKPKVGPVRSQAWKKLTQLKEKIKRLHEKIYWLRLVDVEVWNSSCTVTEVATLQMGAFSMVVDTRRRTIDRGRLFRHKKVSAESQQPAEWMFVMKSVLVTPEGKESLEIIDICSLNIHGLLHKGLPGLRDVSISLKLGRIHIPYDDFLGCRLRMQRLQSLGKSGEADIAGKDISFADMVEELDMPGSREESIVQTVSDSKEFVSSLLRGIQEIQLAVSFIGLSKEIQPLIHSTRPLFLNVAMNEFGIDLFRLDPKSPAHRMYFSPNDIAHQALLAAISISISIDDSGGKPDRLLYIPMATTTVKTTLPSKTIAKSDDKDAAERNTNMLFANLVVTSPSIDLHPKHMPIVVGLWEKRSSKRVNESSMKKRHHLISRLLPKANIKISIQEPVVRIVLPPADLTLKDSDDYDLLISSISSISLDLESSHSSAGELHYALNSYLRINSHRLYYQASSGIRHNLLVTDALELKIQMSATPEVYVVASGNLQTFSVHMVRPEIGQGVHQIVQQMAKSTKSKPRVAKTPADELNFLRRLPPWLLHVQFHGSNFGVEVAGVDLEVAKDPRGIALQLESWNAEYRIQRHSTAIALGKKQSVHRSMSHSTSGDETFKFAPPSLSHKGLPTNMDGRRLAIHVQGFEGYVVEGADIWESEPFISVPRMEVALSTSSDSRGSIFHINSHVKALYMQYSLYRYYAIGVAHTVLSKAFASRVPQADSLSKSKPANELSVSPDGMAGIAEPARGAELITIDLKIAFLQIKASMPSDPPMMLQIYGFEGGRHRWTTPIFKSRLVRVYSEAPKIKSAWVRILSVKTMRVDLRITRRKSGKTLTAERSIDVTSDFIRLAVPHQLILHKVFDNFVNIAKATEQLHHRFKTGTNDYILMKLPEGPKEVPRISLRSRALIFELEDGSFDWKLGLIYRVGLNEQKQRLAREEAFKVKVKKLKEDSQRRENAKSRTQPSHPNGRGRSKHPEPSLAEERSASPRAPSRHGHRGRQMRYDAEATCGLTGSAKISAAEAWNKLQQHNAASWRKRINFAMRDQSSAMTDLRDTFLDSDELPDDAEEAEVLVAIPGRHGLMSTLINDLHIVIDKPSFPLQNSSKFLHDVGKGMPKNMKYSLLIPMSVQVNMGEARVTLRNYPLPLLHVPAMRPGQSPRLPSWSLKTDFIIAEEYHDFESTKHVRVEVVPADKITSPSTVKNGFCIDVRRTVSPVKTYSNVDISINTSNPTSITWGTSYQPAIQDMMQIIEGFTKPQADPSDRTGFWDKIRLLVHSRVRIAWKGDGDVHLKLKGSRDPYVVTGHGAGFVMCFRSNVSWDIHQDDDPKKFMTVKCGEYVMAIPDYSNQARQISHESGHDTESIFSTRGHQDDAMFKKVVMKLSGRVRWLVGLVFERDLQEGGRSFQFIPHYQVKLRTPDYTKSSTHQAYDAFRGFRSQHIHLSVAVIAPVDRDWSVTNLTPSHTYNSIHLTPRFFTHFFDWWSMFSGAMSLPIRQGKLFPGAEKSSKKFGRHLATIKYNLLLSPLFISHIYKHKDAEDYSDEFVSATGLKLRLNSFMLDLHQRREEFVTQTKGRGKQTTTSGMRVNQVQLDFISADIRAVSASIAGTSAEDLKHATDEDLASFRDQSDSTPDISRFTIPDNDYLWIDMDDFVELDWILPSETHPQTKIMPLAFAPRFTYFKDTDHPDASAGALQGQSSFGDEPTHFCIMSHDNDPQRVQCDLLRERIAEIDEQLMNHQRTMGEQKLKVVREGSQDSGVKDQYDLLSQQQRLMKDKKAFMQLMLEEMQSRVKDNKPWRHFSSSANKHSAARTPSPSPSPDSQSHGSQGIPVAEFAPDFRNRFTIHNVQFKWNNSLRNIILRYVHQVSQRRGFVYYMSRRAVKFILDIVEEQNKSKERREFPPQQQASTGQPSPSISFTKNDSDIDLEERIQELLRDRKDFVDANDPMPTDRTSRYRASDIRQNIAEEFTPQNSYHVRLIAPQIQLQSEKNAKSVLLVTAKGMELKVIQIMDKIRMADDVSGLVQRRFSVDMDGVQFFVTNQKTFSKFPHLYSANRYGTPQGSAWPPWVPIEVNFDFHLNPFGWSRVVQKTSASLRYDKFNTLRLKYYDEVSKGQPDTYDEFDDSESRMDHIWVEFPHIRAICDSTQYYTMYLIVLDLLLYSEPLEKLRSERLEKIMLAADFSDLTGAPEMVVSLQERIRQLEEIKAHFQLHENDLDRQGWADRLSIEKDIANCEDELWFLLRSVTTSQRKNDDRTQTSQSNGLLRWYLSASEIVWHLMRHNNEPLVEIQLRHAAYDRTDNSDGSNRNTMTIERIHGLNLLPDALYPEMITPYFENGQASKMDFVLKVQWYMLEAIAGIPVLDNFEIFLHPLNIQLEREVGKKLFEYIFPGNAVGTGPSPFMVKHMALVQDEDESEDEAKHPTPSEPLIAESLITEPPTRAGSIELRLRPTMTLPDPHHRLVTSASNKTKASAVGRASGDSTRFNLFQTRSKSASRSNTSPSIRTISHKRSGESLKSMSRIIGDNSSSMTSTSDRSRRFGLRRSASKDPSADKEKASDDLTEMMSRASSYMTLAYVKIPSVVLCLSYKGRGERNIEDVHNFVFRMPTLEYRNKTWSNLDLALRLKKDIIKALISHTGAIIGNKFSQHRPSKHQQSKLREIANSSSLLPSADDISNPVSRTTTNLHHFSRNREQTVTSNDSFIAGWGLQESRNKSDDSGFDDMISPRNALGTAASHSIQDAGYADSSDSRSIAESDTGSGEGIVMEQNRSNSLGNSSTRRLTSDVTKTRQGGGSIPGRETNDAGLKEDGGSELEERSRRSAVLNIGKKLLNRVN